MTLTVTPKPSSSATLEIRNSGPKQPVGLAERFSRVRQATQALCSGLSAEDCMVQSMPDASPVKWHLAHTTWFFETFILSPHLADYRPIDPEYRNLFNSYYNAVGDR